MRRRNRPRRWRSGIDPQGRDAELKHHARSRQIRCRQIVERGTEAPERLQHSPCVRRVRPHPNVEIFRRAHVAMRRERMGADNDVLNPVGVELG